MNKPNVLIIDDDPDILEILKVNLELYGFGVFSSLSWQEGEIYLKDADIVILDIMLPDKDGYEILKEIKDKNPDIPVIFLTAKDKVYDKVKGLEIGADDYIVKPFETIELIARIKACLRRVKSKCSGQVIYGDLFVDFKRRVVKKSDEVLNLTPKEFEILCYLMSRKGEVVTKEDLKKTLWNEEKLYAWSRAIDVHIMHLRKKIEDDPSKPRYIITVPSVGYKFGE